MRSRLSVALGFTFTLSVTALTGQTGAPAPAVLARVEAHASHFGDVSRQIWELAEPGFKETKSSALLAQELRQAGFRVEEGVAGMPTAFVATWGSGKPVIGIMGEFDALPGLSQETVPEQKARVAGAPGHGCGHNLLGVASLAAAMAVKATARVAQAARHHPLLRHAGRRRRQRQGLHGPRWPLQRRRRRPALAPERPQHRQRAPSTLAVISREVPLQGHRGACGQRAGQGPVGARRGHGDDPRRGPAARAHPAGVAPPLHHHQGRRRAQHRPRTEAEIYMYARHPQIAVLDGIWERVVKTAEAGALATGTTMEMELVGSTPELLPNEAMTALIDRNLREVGGVTYTAEERAFAGTLQKTFMPGTAPRHRRGRDGAPARRAVDPWLHRRGRRELGGAQWAGCWPPLTCPARQATAGRPRRAPAAASAARA